MRLWNVDTGECINSHNFLRPIASVAFNERADELAVAAGHKVNQGLLLPGHMRKHAFTPIQTLGAPMLCSPRNSPAPGVVNLKSVCNF